MVKLGLSKSCVLVILQFFCYYSHLPREMTCFWCSGLIIQILCSQWGYKYFVAIIHSSTYKYWIGHFVISYIGFESLLRWTCCCTNTIKWYLSCSSSKHVFLYCPQSCFLCRSAVLVLVPFLHLLKENTYLKWHKINIRERICTFRWCCMPPLQIFPTENRWLAKMKQAV